MKALIRQRLSRTHQARGATLVEAVVSMIVVGVMMVAALNAVGMSRTTEYKIATRGQGLVLAQELIAEILLQDYSDPKDTVASFGRQLDVVGDGSRLLWVDVDDYNGWSASPPEKMDGTKMIDLPGWERSVEVVWLDPWDLSKTVLADQGVKRITVTVTHNGVTSATLSSLRTSALKSVDVQLTAKVATSVFD